MAERQWLIPKHEPEVIAAGARWWCGSDEKVPTTSLDRLVVHGVELTSRYNKASEYELMARAIEALPPSLRSQVESICCDSKSDCYSVELRHWQPALAKELGRAPDQSIRALCSGHNGITLDGPRLPNGPFPSRLFDVGPHWGGDGDFAPVARKGDDEGRLIQKRLRAEGDAVAAKGKLKLDEWLDSLDSDDLTRITMLMDKGWRQIAAQASDENDPPF
jgi:hypothetical protein